MQSSPEYLLPSAQLSKIVCKTEPNKKHVQLPAIIKFIVAG